MPIVVLTIAHDDYWLFVIYRIVKRSSFWLNAIILAAVFVGCVGTLLFIVKLDPDMSRSSSTALCIVCTNRTNWCHCFIQIFNRSDTGWPNYPLWCVLQHFCKDLEAL